MNITKSKLEALKFYLSFGAPTLVGEPDFSVWCSDTEKFTTLVHGTNFTKEEYLKLKSGEEVFDYLQDQLEEVDWGLECA